MYELILENPIYLVVIALLGAMIFVAKINDKYFASFRLRYVCRLLKISVYSLAGGVALNFFFPDHSLPLRITMAFLIFFLLQTLIYWIFICIEYNDTSSSELFFKFKKSDVSWSDQKEHIEIKKALETLGFKQSGVFESEKRGNIEDEVIADTIYLFSFDSSDLLTRIFITFLPMGETLYMMSSVESLSECNTKIITESGCVFTGLLNPSDYDVKQIDFEGHPLKILKTHQLRIAKKSVKIKRLADDILTSINQSVNDSIQANIDAGIVNPLRCWSDNGVLTSDGKYRLWLAMIRLYYFPF